MSVTQNKELAALFSRIADALEIKAETGFKVIAYQKAARILEDLGEDIARVAEEKRLRDIPGIGSGIARKIEEYLHTGKMTKYEEVMAGVPRGLLELLEVRGLGGKTIHLAWKELGVKDLAGLKRAIEDGSLAGLKGLGAKKVENIRKGLELHEKARERISLLVATAVADEIVNYLRKSSKVRRVSPAGSLRRMKETVGDIDILASGKDGRGIIRHFTEFPSVSRILSAGETKSSVLVSALGGERQVDLRIVADAEYGAALQYFTGSKAHNVKLRGMARAKGLKVSEYGVFKGEKRIAGQEEADVYKSLGLPLIPPELREDRGEVEQALAGKLPRLLEPGDIRGDLHVHSHWSDGHLTLEDLAESAGRLGYEYLAVCDHSRTAAYAGGLSIERLKEQGKEIERLNRTFKDFRILKGIEVDILHDGSLDYPDEILKALDIVIASVHSGFRKNVTERMVRAMQNPWVTAIGHPSGRLLSGREGYEVNMERVIEEAAKAGKALELNAFFDRLDLNEVDLKKAKERGVRAAIGTDTHHEGGLEMMRFGVGIARRAWLEKSDILNGLGSDDLLKLRKKR